MAGELRVLESFERLVTALRTEFSGSRCLAQSFTTSAKDRNDTCYSNSCHPYALENRSITRYIILVGLRERGRKLERKKAASYLLASHLILSTSIFIRLELSMEDHV